MYGDRTDPILPGGIQLFSTSDCTIDDSFVLEGETHNVYCNHVMPTIFNTTISKAGIGSPENYGNGIYCVNGSSPIIEGCDVTNSKESGIYLEDVIDPSGKPEYVSGGAS